MHSSPWLSIVMDCTKHLRTIGREATEWLKAYRALETSLGLNIGTPNYCCSSISSKALFDLLHRLHCRLRPRICPMIFMSWSSNKIEMMGYYSRSTRLRLRLSQELKQPALQAGAYSSMLDEFPPRRQSRGAASMTSGTHQ